MLSIARLTCEDSDDLFGTDILHPRFSWQLASDRPDVVQTAYRIRVSQNPENFEDGLAWDSGKVTSEQSLNVEYQGQPLVSRAIYNYQVKVWDNHAEESDWSAPQSWEMGILSRDAWRAKWITYPFKEARKAHKPAYYFRKPFTLDKALKRVRIYASALGLYEIHVNGKRLGDALFTPGFTDYHHQIQYQTYDPGPLLIPGKNILGVVLGEGWYRGRYQIRFRNCWGKTGAIFLQMALEFEDGTQETLVTDASWKVSTGPILLSDIYDGEAYDATLEAPWQDPAFDDRSWPASRPYSQSATRKLFAQLGEKVRRIETLTPEGVFTAPNGETVVDFGQNLAGWVKLTVHGQRGQQVVVDFGEVLDKEGNFYRKNIRTARAQIVYTCKGGPQETFEPHFTYFGFRYARISGCASVDASTLTAVVIHSDMPPGGSFECSNPLLNQLQSCIRWGEKSNFLEIPTDCPQRDERLGWTGDAQVFARTASFNFDTGRFFTKWLKDVGVSHAFNGAIPFWVPCSIKLPFNSSGWGDAAIVIPWTLYQVYGDVRILQNQFPSMQNWFRFEKNNAQWRKLRDWFHPRAYRRVEQYIWDTGFHFGDWLAPDEDTKQWMAKKPWIATACYAHSAHIMAAAARVLGKAEEAADYERLFHKIREAFCAKFVSPQGEIRHGFQTAYVLALEFDLLPEALKPKAVDFLLKDIQAHDNHLTTGFLGTPLLCFALSNHGQAEAAYRLLLQTSCPSWLYPITRGATTIWERWDGIRPDGGTNESAIGNDNMVSFNHYAFGAIGDWLYRVAAGLELSRDPPGYKRVRIQPQPGGGLDFARAAFHSRFGPLKTGWKKVNGEIALDASIPPNTTAEILLPGARLPEVLLSGQPLDPALGKMSQTGLHSIRQLATGVMIEVGSGDYHFSWRE